MLCRLFLTLLPGQTGVNPRARTVHPELVEGHFSVRSEVSKGPLVLLFTALLLTTAAHAQTPPPVAPSQLAAQGKAGVAPSTAGTPADKMFAQAKQWVAQTQTLTPAAIEFAPLDVRVRIQDCAQPLALDYPFSSKETVRVRCTTEPAWQIYLRLVPPRVAVPSPAAGPQPVAANATRTTVVTRRLLQRGTMLEPDMLEEVTRPALGMDPLAVASLKDVQQAELVRDVPAGVALRSYDIKKAVLVKKGQSALLTVGQGAGFQITVRVEALQDGTLGEQIRLKNAESGRLLSGVVTGPNALKGL